MQDLSQLRFRFWQRFEPQPQQKKPVINFQSLDKYNVYKKISIVYRNS